jgi:DNA-binding NarL/FixJ family response regulator
LQRTRPTGDGHRLTTEGAAQASSIEEGRALLRKEPGYIDVVLTELVLADGSAQEFLKSLKQAYADVSVLVLTGVRYRHSCDLALEMEAAEVLTKDVPVERIVASIKKL